MLRILLVFAALAALAFWLTPPVGQVSGTARVVDGDTLWIGDTKIRLFGVDAPESQTPLGPVATQWLRERIEGRRVTCTERDTDRHGRMVAVCTQAGQDLAEELAAAGLATAYRRFSTDYVDEELAAKSAGVGIWNASAQTDLPDCPIKGNISNSGRYYHMPGMRSYDNVRIDTSKGERWFCSEAEARTAGWTRVP